MLFWMANVHGNIFFKTWTDGDVCAMNVLFPAALELCFAPLGYPLEIWRRRPTTWGMKRRSSAGILLCAFELFKHS